jgi:hypothetical protein
VRLVQAQPRSRVHPAVGRRHASFVSRLPTLRTAPQGLGVVREVRSRRIDAGVGVGVGP